MSANHVQDESLDVRMQYRENLARVIARNADLQQEIEKLSALWEVERSQLKTRVVQLEHALVDLIERSNNPLRTTLISEEKIRFVEEAKREWSAQWKAERSQLLAELSRLRG